MEKLILPKDCLKYKNNICTIKGHLCISEAIDCSFPDRCCLNCFKLKGCKEKEKFCNKKCSFINLFVNAGNENRRNKNKY